VRLFDLVAEHVAAAAALPGVDAQVADARDLPLGDASADAVLVLGPLYHLVDPGDRALALREAARVSRGLVVAAAISRYAGLLDLGAHGLLDAAALPRVRRAIETGVHDPALGFTVAYFHLPEELEAELQAAGLRDVAVYGVEGPSGPALDAHGMERLDEFLPAALECARTVERDPRLLAASAHLLARGAAAWSR
jgi:ubiquinone/menaquinone biosynthesis C-methylase UbiE